MSVGSNSVATGEHGGVGQLMDITRENRGRLARMRQVGQLSPRTWVVDSRMTSQQTLHILCCFSPDLEETVQLAVAGCIEVVPGCVMTKAPGARRKAVYVTGYESKNKNPNRKLDDKI